MTNLSPLQIERLKYQPKLPSSLANGINHLVSKEGSATESVANQEEIKALFKNTYGRTDLPTSCFEDIINSISSKIIVLPEETIIYPGHGKSTRIGDEEPIYLELKPKKY